MRKLTDFIVKRRNIFLSVFIILAIFSLYLSKRVNINEDIMAYLPKNSETKIGKDIMEEEFSKEDTSTLNVMFKDLANKEEILKELENIDGVSKVNYQNKGKYTLYVLTVDDYANSKNSLNVYNQVKNTYKNIDMSGSIYDENKPLLKMWVVILAIICAMIILITISTSYIEPFLYLITIGIAIFINKGTNIMFSSVSSITNSIASILQLALSMDYSIMLSNRYSQEKMKSKDKISAMEEALYHSFSSISSSSVTTVVGLFALVFMSFTIGKDLGFVLGKGVILSLLSIFFCLPALLLMFDTLIEKTKKKTIKFDLTKLGVLIYKTKFISIPLIIIIFLLTFILKGNINILYTGSEQDKVGNVFGSTNQIAIVYNNKYEDLMSKLCKNLETNENIDKCLSYANTLNEKLRFNELNQKFKELKQDTEIDEYLLKIIYYNYFNKSTNKMTLNEFINFIKKEVYTNPSLKNEIDDNTKNNLNLLSNFTSKEEIQKKRSTKDIANILGISENDIIKIMLVYNSQSNSTTLTIDEFIRFLVSDLSKDEDYANYLTTDMKNKLNTLSQFTNIDMITTKYGSKELAGIFNIDEKTVEDLFLYYHTKSDSPTSLTINEFATTALIISEKEEYQGYFDESTLAYLRLLAIITNKEFTLLKMNYQDLSIALNNIGINLDNDTLLLLDIYYTGLNSTKKMNILEFIEIVLNSSYFSEDTIQKLSDIKNILNVRNIEMSQDNLYTMFDISIEEGMNITYLLTGDPSGTYTMTPYNFANTLLTTSSLDETRKENLQKLIYLMENAETMYSYEEMASILNNTQTPYVYGLKEYSLDTLLDMSIKDVITFIYNNKDNSLLTPYQDKLSSISLIYNMFSNLDTKYSITEMSSILNTDKEKVNMIYAIYDYSNGNTKLSPLELVDLIIDNKDDELLKGKVISLEELYILREVMRSSIENKKYTYREISNLLNINSEKTSLLYSLYNYKKKGNVDTISLYEFVSFTRSNIMNNKEYSKSFDSTNKTKLNTIYSVMTNSLNGVKYTSSEAFGTLKILSGRLNKTLIDLVYIYYGSEENYNNDWKMTIEEFVKYLNDDIITDSRFNEFLDVDMLNRINDAEKKINKSKKLLVSNDYSRIVLYTKYPFEDKETFAFISSIHDYIQNKDDIYVVGNSSMASEMSKTFDKELNKITLLTMIFIFIVVAITFKDLLIPFILVIIIQTSVYVTMSFISLTSGSVYFIALLIVQAILMGATIDYAIVYTAYYKEERKKYGVKESIINAYNNSIHTIISSSSILIIVTLIVSKYASVIASKICETISLGTFVSVLLILIILPGILAASDKLICRD